MADMVNEKIGDDEITNRRNNLVEDCKQIYEKAPQTSNRAYKVAGRKLKKKEPNQGEDATLKDDEIDHFLPWMLQYKYLKPYKR